MKRQGKNRKNEQKKRPSCLPLSHFPLFLFLFLSLSSCFISPFIPFPAAQSQPPWNHCHIRAFNWLWLAQHWHYTGIATPILFPVVPLHSLSVSIMFHHPSANQLSSQTTFKRARKPKFQFLFHASPKPVLFLNRHIFRVVLYWAVHRMFGTFKDGMAS